MTIDEIKRTVRLCRSGAFAVERLEKALAGLHAVAVYVSFDFHYSTGDGARFKIDLQCAQIAEKHGHETSSIEGSRSAVKIASEIRALAGERK